MMELTRGKAKIAQIQKWWTSAVVMYTLLQIDNTAFNSFEKFISEHHINRRLSK